MTTTVHMDAFLPMIMPYVGTCPQMVVTYQLRQAAIEFCEVTRLWRHTITQNVLLNDFRVEVPHYASLACIRDVAHDGRQLDPVLFDPHAHRGHSGSPRHYSEPSPNRLRIDPFAPGVIDLDAVLKPRQGHHFFETQDGAASTSSATLQWDAETGVNVLIPTAPGGAVVAPDDPEGDDITVSITFDNPGNSIGVQQDPIPSSEDAYDVLPEFLHRDHGDVLAHGAIANVAMLPNQEYTNLELAQFHMMKFREGLNRLSVSPLQHQVRPPLRTKTAWF